MKKLKFMIILPLMALFVQNAAAEGQSTGLYLTSHDYVVHKVSFGADNDKIKVSGLFGTNKVVVIEDGKKQFFAKSEIFGYIKDGDDYRFFNNAEYQILSNNGLVIYSHTSLVQQGKGPKPTELFYFSAGLTATILPLSIANLESVYGKNPKFIYAVESLFKSDNQLASYDFYNKQYKLAYLYTQNMK